MWARENKFGFDVSTPVIEIFATLHAFLSLTNLSLWQRSNKIPPTYEHVGHDQASKEERGNSNSKPLSIW